MSPATFTCEWEDCGKKYESVRALRKHKRLKGHYGDSADVMKSGTLLCPIGECNSERYDLCYC